MKNSGQIITELLNSQKSIKEITLVEFPNVQPLQRRFDLQGNDSIAINRALEIREKYSLPFWDAILLTQFDSELYSDKILIEAQFHNSIKTKIKLQSKNFNLLNDYIEKENKNYGINSMVLLDNNEEMHIPLLDFHIPNKPENHKCVLKVLKELKVSGHLFETNRSFHFIGDSLITLNQLQTFLSKALLFSPIIDKNWIAHQLIEKSCTIRLTKKDGNFPNLISSF